MIPVSPKQHIVARDPTTLSVECRGERDTISNEGLMEDKDGDFVFLSNQDRSRILANLKREKQFLLQCLVDCEEAIDWLNRNKR